MNKLLQRQVQKHYGKPENVPVDLASLLDVISESYDHYEKDRNMLERCIELSSNEMIWLNDKLRKESAELKNANYNLNTLFKNIQEVFFSAEFTFVNQKPTFKTLQISPACLAVYGYESEDFLRSSTLWQNLTIDEDKEIIAKYFPLLLKGEAIAHDYRITHKDGTVRWIHTKITPTLNEAGVLTRIDGVTNDINEKKLAEKKLEDAHRELNRILENMSEVVFSLNVVTGKYAYISSACNIVYGYPVSEFIKDPQLWKDVVHPEDKHIIDKGNEALFEGKTVSRQFRIIHSSKSIRWLVSRIEPKLDENGKLVMLDIFVNDITETKEAQQKLESANSNFDKLFNNLSEVLYSIDMVSYRLIQMSAACEKVYGYSSKEFLTKHELWQSVIHPDDLHISRSQVETLYKGQQVFNQYRIIHKDGNIRWIENKVIPTLDENGKLIRLDGVTNDITSKRYSAQKLQDSEVRFRTLIENGTDMLTLLSAEGKIVYESPTVTKTLGYAPGENTNRSGFDMLHPDDLKLANETLIRTIRNHGEPIPITVRVKAKNGAYVITEGHVTNMLHVQGINAIVSNFRDVTQRIEAEQNFAESQDRYKMVFENPFLGIAIGSINGIIQNVNDAFCKMLGYSQQELKDNHFDFFTFPEDTGKEMPYILQMANGEIGTYQLEKRYITKSKVIIWVELSVSAVKGPTGEISFVVAVVQDITPKKTAEDSLRKSEVNLSAIIENTDAHVYSLDRECRYLTFNSNLRNSVKDSFNIEIKPGDVTYAYLEEHDPVEAKFWKETYAKAFMGINLQFVKDYSTKEYRDYISFSIHPIVENNIVIGLSCFSRNITQQTLAEESLYKSEANLRNILENTDTAYVLLNNNATILSYNHISQELALEEMGETLEEGKNYVDLMRVERREEVRQTINGVLNRKESITYETKYITPGKPDKWLTVSIYPILDEEKNVIGLSVAALDISNRKKNEQLIKLSNERHELVTKATNDVIWDWDIVNNKIYRSKNYTQVFGYESGDNIYAGTSGMHIHPEDSARIIQSITEKIADTNATLWEDEYRYFRKNEEMAYVQDRGYIVFDENKKPVRMVGAMRDITAEKLFALERDKITADLIRQNKNHEQFAYIVSHNLRAPLANISGLVRIIQGPNLEAKIKKISMDGLVTSVKKLDDVIIDLTNILQVKRGINEKRETLEFSSLLEDIKLSVDNFIEKEHVCIHTNFSATHIFSVKSYMYSIFYNLISNSIKYKEPGRNPVIEISSNENENKTILTFKDNGIGIDLKLYGDKIFGLYKRFHYDVEGKGMGLFMVKTQVESLEGNITISSQLGRGTIFTIEFDKKFTEAPLTL